MYSQFCCSRVTSTKVKYIKSSVYYLSRFWPHIADFYSEEQTLQFRVKLGCWRAQKRQRALFDSLDAEVMLNESSGRKQMNRSFGLE